MPISALSDEILSRIFCCVSRARITPDNFKNLGSFNRSKIKPTCKNLLLVCSKWHDLAQGDDRLWYFFLRLSIAHGQDMDAIVAKVDLRPNCDVALELNCPSMYTGLDITMEDFTTIQNTLILLSHRLQACAITVTMGWRASDVLSLLGYLSFPRLVMLNISMASELWTISQSVPHVTESGIPAMSRSNTPMIESLYFQSELILFPETDYLQNLSRLSISNSGYTRWNWKETILGLSVCKGLHTLSLDDGSGSSSAFPCDFMIELPRLQQLRVAGGQAVLIQILTVMRTPELILLSIIFRQGGPTGDTNLPPPDALLKLQNLIINCLYPVARRFLTAMQFPSLEYLRILAGGGQSVKEPAALQWPCLTSLDVAIYPADFTWLMRGLSLSHQTPFLRHLTLKLLYSGANATFEGFLSSEMQAFRDISTLSILRPGDEQSYDIIRAICCAAESVEQLHLSYIVRFGDILKPPMAPEMGPFPLPSLHLIFVEGLTDEAALQHLAELLQSRAASGRSVQELQLSAKLSEENLARLREAVASVTMKNSTPIGGEKVDFVE